MTSTPSAPSCGPTDAGAADADRVRDLYREHGASLLRLGMRLTGGDRYWAEDLVQDCIVAAWRHPTPPDRPVWPWLATVLRHRFLDQVRARRARPREVLGPAAVEGRRRPATEETAGDLEPPTTRERRLAAAVTALPDIHRQVVVEVYYHDRSVAQTAHRLKVAPGTVKSRLFHARRALRCALSQ